MQTICVLGTNGKIVQISVGIEYGERDGKTKLWFRKRIIAGAAKSIWILEHSRMLLKFGQLPTIARSAVKDFCKVL